MLRLTAAFWLILGIGIPAFASSPDPKSLAIPTEELTRARELVHQLGSEDFDEREKAEAELAKMGRLARPALVEAANTDPSQEVRSRCTSLLPRATALDIKARLDVFLADTEDRYDHDLPGWSQFRSRIRGEWTLFGYPIGVDHSLDHAARSVFVELLSSHVNRPLVMAVDGPKSELSGIATARRQELYYQKFPRRVAGGRMMRSGQGTDPSVEDIATLLYLESFVPAKMVGRTTSITNLIASSGFAQAVNTTGDRAKVYRAIAAAWFDSRNDPFEMYQIMTLASSLGLSEHGCRIGIRLLTEPGVIGAYRGLAASNLAHLGNKDHIPLLEKALVDSTVGFTIRNPNRLIGRLNEVETHDVQVRDMALAAAIILAGENLADYGFVDAYASSGALAGNSYTYSRYYIPDNERTAMHEKWKTWWAAHKSWRDK